MIKPLKKTAFAANCKSARFESEKSGCLCVGQVFFVCCGQRPRRTTFPAFWNLVMGTASN